jgi:hypothetical protein
MHGLELRVRGHHELITVTEAQHGAIVADAERHGSANRRLEVAEETANQGKFARGISWRH